MEQQWSSTAKAILWAIAAEIIAAFLATIFSALTTGAALMGNAEGTGTFGVLAIIFVLAELAAFIIYFLKLNKFITLQTNKPDADAISMVRNSVIVSVAAIICGCIPVIGWVIALLLGIAAAVMMIIGFNSFSKSTALPAMGLNGASQLKIYAILVLVASIIIIIPAVGAILSGICSLIGLVFLFLGWSNVSKGCPAPREAGAPFA